MPGLFKIGSGRFCSYFIKISWNRHGLMLPRMFYVACLYTHLLMHILIQCGFGPQKDQTLSWRPRLQKQRQIFCEFTKEQIKGLQAMVNLLLLEDTMEQPAVFHTKDVWNLQCECLHPTQTLTSVAV